MVKRRPHFLTVIFEPIIVGCAKVNRFIALHDNLFHKRKLRSISYYVVGIVNAIPFEETLRNTIRYDPIRYEADVEVEVESRKKKKNVDIQF